MKNFLLSFAGGLLALIVFFVMLPILFLGMISMSMSGGDDERPGGDIVITMDLRAGYPDQTPQDGFAAIFGQTSFVDVLTRLDAAASDDQVKAVYLRASEMGIGSARAEELRDAIIKLKEAGKPVIAHSQGFMFGTPSPYRAVSAVDELWMQSGSDFAVSGIMMESLFARDLLDKIGVKAEIVALHEYKSAPDMYTKSSMTDAARESYSALGGSVWDESIRDITSDRGHLLTTDLPMRELLANSPFDADEAVRLGLADKTGWPEDAMRDLEARFEGAAFMDISAYIPPEPKRNAPVFALVGGEGPIMTGASGNDFSFSSDAMIASDTVSAQIYEAAEDEDVRAIVFRVDSPGGSAIASDQIWRAVNYARTEKNKPVIVSMGSVAASGGYYVSMGADRIVAPRTAITGSIGIFGGRLAMSEALAKIGVNVDGVQIGDDYIGTLHSVKPMTNAQRSEWYDRLEAGYNRFVGMAAEGRGMSFDDLQSKARGRVWSGADAQEIGLIDETGGLIKAIEVAKEVAGLAPDEKVTLRKVVPDQTPFEALGAMFGASSAELRTLSMISKVASDPELARMLGQIEAMQDGGAQMSAPIIIER